MVSHTGHVSLFVWQLFETQESFEISSLLSSLPACFMILHLDFANPIIPPTPSFAFPVSSTVMLRGWT